MNLTRATDEILAAHPGMDWQTALSEASYRETHPQVTYTYHTTPDGRVDSTATVR
jgi:hypothetical protein